MAITNVSCVSSGNIYGKYYSYDPSTDVGFCSAASTEEKVLAEPKAVQRPAVAVTQDHAWLYNTFHKVVTFLDGPGLPPLTGCETPAPNKPTLSQTLTADGGGLSMTQPPIPDAANAYRTESGATIIPPPAPDASAADKPVTTVNPAADASVDEANPASVIDSGNSSIDSGNLVTQLDTAPWVDPTKSTVYLPTTDAGVPLLPDDIWFPSKPFPFVGAAAAFKESPTIQFTIEFAAGAGLKDLDLAIELGTDSSRLPLMPVNVCYDGGAPVNVCYDGMIRINLRSDEDKANNLPGCPNPGYSEFLSCPGPVNDLNLYLAGYTLDGWVWDGEHGKWILPKENIVSVPPIDTNVLFQDTSKGTLLGSMCGASAPNLIRIPKSFYAGDWFKPVLGLPLVVDTRNVPPVSDPSKLASVSYETAIWGRIIALPKNPDGGTADGGPVDGGTK